MGGATQARAAELAATVGIEHATRFIPLADKKRGREPIDRGDTLISGAQILLGAREVDSERIVDPSRSPVYTGSLF